jgi:hypothetical protein
VPQAASSLFDDLDAVLRDGSPDKSVGMLRRFTGLFHGDADRSNDAQIGVFDEIVVHPINNIEAKMPAEISARTLHRR